MGESSRSCVEGTSARARPAGGPSCTEAGSVGTSPSSQPSPPQCVLATLAGAPPAVANHGNFPSSAGIYRIPYADGSTLTVSNDHHNHGGFPGNNRFDMVADATPTTVVAAASGVVMAIVDIHGNSDPDGDGTGNGDGLDVNGNAGQLLLDGVTVHTDAAEHSCQDANGARRRRRRRSSTRARISTATGPSTSPTAPSSGSARTTTTTSGSSIRTVSGRSTRTCRRELDHRCARQSRRRRYRPGRRPARHRSRHRLRDEPPPSPRSGGAHQCDRRHPVLRALHRALDPRRRRRGPDEYRVLRRWIHPSERTLFPSCAISRTTLYVDNTTSPGNNAFTANPCTNTAPTASAGGSVLRRRRRDRAARRDGQQRSRERDPELLVVAGDQPRRPDDRDSAFTPRSTTRSTRSTSP